ncbi:MAG: ATP-dependent RecD-like DNA helicase [Lachnospiraceae bacterium]|jgi:exodeoxyribonuclease V alpha subunit|nr:ATP-dependent RecD-like DNA helicase [Lachnospiraceae bacterium]
MDHLRCVVERITYQNADNGYTVLKCAVKNAQDLVTVVGIMPDTHVGSVLALEGVWKVDAKYGRQFSVEKFEETLPATVYGIEKYLGSGLIKGVGPKFARRIVEKFGKDTLDVIEENPDALIEVEGIGRVRVERIRKSWEEQKEIKNIMLFLQGHEVSTSHATKIFKTYGSDSISVVQENPYRLADDIWGIGFKTADTIAEKMGIEKDRFIRLRSGILYTLNKLSENGHCYAVREQLIQAAVQLLEVEEAELEITLDEMLRTEDVIREEEAIYLPPFFFSETGCAKRLLKLLAAERRVQMDVDTVMETVMGRTGQGQHITYDEVQLEAIRAAVSSKIMVLTGGPGTGKTTTTMGIIAAYRAAGCRIILAAPTGRAAKRMSEATGMEAKTIHRLLEYKPPEGYQRKEENPLEGDVLILDECSMIDIMLMYNLLKAMPEQMTLIMVGDTDQLPSVGAGNVLKDIISSGRIPVVRLSRIFRQAQGSRIIMNAHRINKGEQIDMRGGRDSDFFFAAKETNEEVVELLVKYCTENLPRYYHVDALQDIQVLTPMQRGVCGAANLNQVLQEAMNPGSIFLRRGGTQYRLHDKVMQIRNDYDKEVFNGDIGVINHVDMEERELTVNFDGREVVYDVSELEELTLAYATTIHKSQGSEYPIVVMPFTMSHYVMLQRNLLYTGVTRAKKILVLIGEKKAVWYAVKNETTADRNTKLAERLREDSMESRIVARMVQTERAGRQSDNNAGRAEAAAGDVPAARSDRQEVPAAGSLNQNKVRMIRYKGGAQPSMVGEQPALYSGSLFQRLGQSEFRSSFSLKSNDRNYVREKGMDTVRKHAQDFIAKRLSPAAPANDGRQTPMRGHPVFVAQHATATCCRGCLAKWHGIAEGEALSESEQEYLADVIMEWIRRQMETT